MKAALLLLTLVRAAWSESLPSIPWKQFDDPQTWCAQTLNLRMPENVFFPIGNDLPGRDAFNDIVRDFQAGRYQAVESSIQAFHQHFENSELREPLTFLGVVTSLRQVEAGKIDVRDAELKLRTALLLFPKSTYAPTTVAELAGVFVKRKDFQRGLAAYLSLESDYPNHPLHCVFQVGVADLTLRIGNLSDGNKQIEKIRSKCRDSASLAFVAVRTGELSLQRLDSKSTDRAQKLWVQHNSWVEGEYPVLLFNLAEALYRDGKYSDARHFFSRFLQAPNPVRDCRLEAQKRIGDIDHFSGKPVAGAFGEYLATRELDPESDLGKFARAHALLITYGSQSSIEKERRMREVLDTVRGLKTDRFRVRLELERATVLAADGDLDAVPLLDTLRRTDPRLAANSELTKFLQWAWLRYAEKQIQRGGSFATALEPIRRVYPNWIQSTVNEPVAKAAVRKAALKAFETHVQSGRWGDAISVLETWSGSDFKEAPIRSETRLWIVEALLGRIRKEAAEGAAPGEVVSLDTALAIREAGSRWSPFLGEEFAVIPSYASWIAGDEAPFRALLPAWKKRLPDFGGVSIAGKATLLTLLASGLRHAKEFSLAERAVASIPETEKKEEAREFQYQLLLSQGDIEGAFRVGVEVLGRKPKGEKDAWLGRLLAMVHEGQLWRKGESLLGEARKAGLSGRALVPYEFLAARAKVESGDCAKAVSLYRGALRSGSEHPESAEARFRLAKCLLRVRQPAEARGELEKLVKAGDVFWSPLARNELQLLRKK